MSETVNRIVDKTIEWLKDYQLQIMENYSEDRWCAGWMDNLEMELWHDPGDTGRLLREIAEATQVWWIWDAHYDDGSGFLGGNVALPLSEWKRQAGTP